MTAADGVRHRGAARGHRGQHERAPALRVRARAVGSHAARVDRQRVSPWQIPKPGPGQVEAAPGDLVDVDGDDDRLRGVDPRPHGQPLDDVGGLALEGVRPTAGR